MRRLWSALVLAAAALFGLLQAVARRLLRGPTVPGWSWSMELRRAALAALIVRAIARAGDRRPMDRMTPVTPMPRSLRNRLRVGPAVSGGVAGEWIQPRDGDGRGPVLLYLHGGGYVMGSPAMERPFIASIAVAAGAAHVFSADYRLAPEHRYPAAVDDAVAAYLGMLDGGVDPARLVVVGDSAGGGLAMALLISLRDAGHPLPAGAVLFSPWVDLTNRASTLTSNAATDYLPPMVGRAAVEYLGDADPGEPTASPVRADLTGLPPMLILAGGREMILEDSTRLVERAHDHGVDAELVVEPDMFHVWPVVVPRHAASLRAIETAGHWIVERAVGSVGLSGGVG
jgi:epsilon-lactone hydrolase